VRPIQGHQWGMTVDLNCASAATRAWSLPAREQRAVVGKTRLRRARDAWIRVRPLLLGEPSGSPEMVFQPIPCMQCEDAPCEQVCPVEPPSHNGEGLNVMVYNRCIGTRYCSNNCPYKCAASILNFKGHARHPQARDEPGRHSPARGA